MKYSALWKTLNFYTGILTMKMNFFYTDIFTTNIYLHWHFYYKNEFNTDIVTKKYFYNDIFSKKEEIFLNLVLKISGIFVNPLNYTSYMTRLNSITLLATVLMQSYR